MIWFACKRCQKRHNRPDAQAGSMVFCDCGNGITVPWTSTSAPEVDALPAALPAPPEPPRPARPQPPPPSRRDVPRPTAVPVPIPDALPASAAVPSRGRSHEVNLPLGPRRAPALLGKVNPNFCFAHDESPPVGECSECRLPFCAACLAPIQGQALCGPCKNFRLASLGRRPRVLPLANLALVVSLVFAPVGAILSLGAVGLGIGEGLFAAPLALALVAAVFPGLSVYLAARALRQLEDRPEAGGTGRATSGLCVALTAGTWCLAGVGLLVGRHLFAG